MGFAGEDVIASTSLTNFVSLLFLNVDNLLHHNSLEKYPGFWLSNSTNLGIYPIKVPDNHHYLELDRSSAAKDPL